MLKIIKKINSFLIILTLVFCQFFPGYVQATQLDPSLTDQETLNEAGVELNEGVSEAGTNAQMTVKRKLKGPTVVISFTSDNFFKAGSKITALAETNGFLTPKNKLYYTWYIKHSQCSLTDGWWGSGVKDDSESKLKNCDLDNDQKITPNDWKIVAARLNVQGGFDKAEAEYKTYNEDKAEASGATADPVVAEDDGWVKNFKRHDDGTLYTENTKDAPNCSLQHPISGLIYELSETQSKFVYDVCPASYSPACINQYQTTCGVLNPQFKDNPDPPGTKGCQGPDVLDSITGLPLWSQQCLYEKTIQNQFESCKVQGIAHSEEEMSEIFDCGIDSETNDDGEENEINMLQLQGKLSCKNGGIVLCMKDENNIIWKDGTDASVKSILPKDRVEFPFGVIFKKDATDLEICEQVAKYNKGEDPSFEDTNHTDDNNATPVDPLDPPPYFLDNSQLIFDTNHTSCKFLSDALLNGVTEDSTITANGVTTDFDDPVIKPDKSLKIENSGCTFEEARNGNGCKHLFPYFPEREVVVDNQSFKLDKEDMAGDGKFTSNEKRFWGADPNPDVVSTNGEQGKPDEAVVIGEGINKMTWTYSLGDEIGVVVEGESDIATEHADASYAKMWAFSQGVCSELEEIEDKNSIDDKKGTSGEKNGHRGFYVEGLGNGIYTTNFDLDRCLEENLEAPHDEGESAMKTELSFTPKHPVNDPAGLEGDSLTVVASSQNVSDLSNAYYTWKIEAEKEPSGAYPNENAEWVNITDKVLTASDKQGLGKNSITFLLNLTKEIIDFPEEGNTAEFYLRIRSKVEEKSGEGNKKSEGVAIIKIHQMQYNVEAFAVTAEAAGGTLSRVATSGNNPSVFCDEKSGICQVTKNKIIGIDIKNTEGEDSGLTNFSWTVNSVPMACTEEMFAGCGDGNTGIFIFPVLGNPGESINVTAKAVTGSGDVTTITKRFIIVEPSIILDYDKGAVLPKLMGFYLDLEGTRTPDLSGHVFETTLAATENSDPESSGITSGGEVTFTAIVNSAWTDASEFEWMVDGEIQESGGSSVTFPIEKMVGDSYSINVIAKNQLGKSFESGDDEQRKKINILRKALRDYWNVLPEESIEEEDLFLDVQLNIVDQLSAAEISISQKLEKAKNQSIFASLATNIPEQMMFLLRISLTSFALLFLMGLLFSLMPEAIFERKK